MTAYTDDDVTAGAAALVALVKQHPSTPSRVWDGRIGYYGAPGEHDLTRAVLDAVAPLIAARVLREAAEQIDDDWPDIYLGERAVTWGKAAEWLRARAEQVNP